MKKNDDKKGKDALVPIGGTAVDQKLEVKPTKLVRLTTSQIHNLKLLEKMSEFDHNFKSYAQSVNALFYSYVQVMQSHKEELALTENEIYNISEIANFFGNIQSKYE